METSIELQPRSSIQALSSEEQPPEGTTVLPQADGGRKAWTFLAAATILEALVWGLPFSIGVLHTYWTTVKFPPGTEGEGLVTLAATLQTGLMYMLCIVFGPLLAAYPHRCRQLQLLGLAVTVISLISTAFVTKPWHLILSLGLLYPFSALMYFPAATLLYEWFTTRRGLASGILYAGTGAGGTAFPFLVQLLLDRFGYKTAMISLAIGYGLIAFLAVLFITPRIPITRHQAIARRRVSMTFLRSSAFWAFVGAITLTSLGNFIPSVFIPSFADDIGVTKPDGTAILAILNASSVPGTLLIGYLSDHLPTPIVILISCLGSALSCLFLWGFATTPAVLITFAVVFGALGPSFSGIWTKMISIIAKDDPTTPALIFSLFAFARGVGNIASGPISNALLTSSSLPNAMGAYGVKNYGPLLLYVGTVMVAGSAVGVSYRTK